MVSIEEYPVVWAYTPIPGGCVFQDCIKRLNECKDLHEEDQDFLAINVGCMQPYMNYEPQSLKELLEARGIEIPEKEKGR